MNETIGAKGGHRDNLRTKKIKQAKKKKLDLEKEVKKKQKYTLIKTLPIVIVGGTIKTMYDVSKVKTTKKKTNNKKTKEIEKIPKKNTKKEIKIIKADGKEIKVIVPNNTKTIKKEKEAKKEKKGIGTTQEEYDINKDFETSIINEETLPEKSKDKLQKLKSRKIISIYEKQLKDIRHDLRNLIFEYNVLVDNSDKIILSEEAEIILDKLSEIIEKIEELKKKIKIDDLDKYDDNYIYTLIEGYLEEFKDKKVIKEIKDSPLYIMIQSKLDELDSKKNSLNKKVSEKKDNLEEKEEKFDKLQDKYIKMLRINEELDRFEKDQEKLLAIIKDKVDKSVVVEEKIRKEIELADINSRRLMGLLMASLFVPGPTIAKKMATSTAAYLYFLNAILRPNIVTKKYENIYVTDYENQIKGSIKDLEDAGKLLGKTSKDVEKIIKELKKDYGEYFGVIKESDDLLNNLNKIKNELEEKEYEIEKMKNEQLLILERNNAKVKTRGSYLMSTEK